MKNFYEYMNAMNVKPTQSESVVQDEKPEVKPTVKCGLCQTEKDKKSGECKFDEGAEKPVRDSLIESLEALEESENGEVEEEGEKVVIGSDAASPLFESQHPRAQKGEKGAGQFKPSPKTIAKEDDLSPKGGPKEDKPRRKKFTINEITDWEEDSWLIDGDASHEGSRAVERLVEQEKREKIDEGKATGLPFTCEAEDIDEALEKYNEEHCEYDYLKAVECDYDEE